MTESTTPAPGTTHRIYTHPTRKVEPWGQEVRVLAVSPTGVFFRIGKANSSMTQEEWAEATSLK